ncbi:hypothetical protein HN832_02945 [archaeon]|jgi:hypothetical protein|nr:hypothetical protein [archaeon]MBT4373313.1 hypothetical protein [archaeon]MBT4531658.1 hypothetical protein [archaeon]MBT7001164.1 hypothetical protein [archaeon]MBT7282350.1 hypothetical protein [archaeon]
MKKTGILDRKYFRAHFADCNAEECEKTREEKESSNEENIIARPGYEEYDTEKI